MVLLSILFELTDVDILLVEENRDGIWILQEDGVEIWNFGCQISDDLVAD